MIRSDYFLNRSYEIFELFLKLVEKYELADKCLYMYVCMHSYGHAYHTSPATSSHTALSVTFTQKIEYIDSHYSMSRRLYYVFFSVYVEAEYTFRLRKKIVPLRLQPKYYPDGWLGILVGSKLVFDCSLQEKIEDSIRHLIRELTNVGQGEGRWLISTVKH